MATAVAAALAARNERLVRDEFIVFIFVSCWTVIEHGFRVSKVQEINSQKSPHGFGGVTIHALLKRALLLASAA
jgi:hypothetical protein